MDSTRLARFDLTQLARFESTRLGSVGGYALLFKFVPLLVSNNETAARNRHLHMGWSMVSQNHRSQSVGVPLSQQLHCLLSVPELLDSC